LIKSAGYAGGDATRLNLACRQKPYRPQGLSTAALWPRRASIFLGVVTGAIPTATDNSYNLQAFSVLGISLPNLALQLA
jgi:hypothetical protein